MSEPPLMGITPYRFIESLLKGTFHHFRAYAGSVMEEHINGKGSFKAPICEMFTLGNMNQTFLKCRFLISWKNMKPVRSAECLESESDLVKLHLVTVIVKDRTDPPIHHDPPIVATFKPKNCPPSL